SLLVVASSGAISNQPPPLTLEQFLSAPFPTELTAGPSGAIAWVFNDRGARNVWIAEPPDYKGRRLTSFLADDGQEISDLAFSADGKSIVFVRGGGANRRGETPNPGSSAEGAEQAVFAAPASGGVPRRLGEGHAPAVSPRGVVAYVLKEQV